MFVKKCGARARTNHYHPCRQPAMKNGKCRLHGGLARGPKSKEGIERIKATRTKHGLYTKSSLEQKRILRSLIQESKNLLMSFNEISHANIQNQESENYGPSKPSANNT